MDGRPVKCPECGSYKSERVSGLFKIGGIVFVLGVVLTIAGFWFLQTMLNAVAANPDAAAGRDSPLMYVLPGLAVACLGTVLYLFGYVYANTRCASCGFPLTAALRLAPQQEPQAEVLRDAPLAAVSGRLATCPHCGKKNPEDRTSCQWCHKAFRVV